MLSAGNSCYHSSLSSLCSDEACLPSLSEHKHSTAALRIWL